MSSGHSLQFSRWACRFSILAMLEPRESVFDAPGKVYLHTLTFKDPEPTYEEGRRRWQSFRKGYLERNGWFGVCVPEYGKRTGRLHLHLVTTKRPDSATWWQVVDRYGFGRYDVRERPAWRVYPNSTYGGRVHEAAWYIAKYVGKRQDWPEELRGCRQWSVFGGKYFPHGATQTRDVRITRETLTVVPESQQAFADWSEWRCPEYNVTCRHAIRADARETGHTRMVTLNNEQTKKLLSLALSGDFVGVGEYRGCGIETKKFKDFKNPSRQVERVIVTHRIDCGASLERREFEELLPEGTDAKTITPPAKSGEIVACTVLKVRTFNGRTTYNGPVVKL